MKKIFMSLVIASLLALLSLMIGSIWFNLSMSHDVWAPGNYIATWFGLDGEASYDALWWEQTFIVLVILLIALPFSLSKLLKKESKVSFILISSTLALFLDSLILYDIVSNY
ncbi:hypothetical protein [Kangiella koreensis]|uniref:Uncharacterized protein n=1 Tax=Kangiella koreensis (strain DSM 16069 / JCM 12317 / KCTC 12182 / SW-125) TaxID=523791 RepID=C7R923_KANKD|nr:hypothetical protein [Kangiella koreensis]ACV27813.1 hypothetical protein Kkor_2404 [Kangiella koreensis DSM 16069]